MKKKVLALILCAMMAATAVVGGTLAYFSDTDADVNVMTAGNVKIIQDEWQINPDTELGYEEFENGQPLFPYTGKTNEKGIATEYTENLVYPYGEDGDDENHWGDTARNVGKFAFSAKNNAISKIVTVTNTGTMPAYIRTLFAFEIARDAKGNVINPAAEGTDMLNFGMSGYDTNFKWTDVIITINDTEFLVGEYYYSTTVTEADGTEKTSALAPKTTSHSSLNYIYLSPLVGNEWYATFGKYYNIIAVSQAAQTNGFDTAKAALDTAFGEVVAKTADGKDMTETIQAWFVDNTEDDVVFVETKHETYDALSNEDKVIFEDKGTNVGVVADPKEQPAG